MSIWLIRAGSHGEYEQKFIQENRVYVTWEGLDVDLSKLPNRDALAHTMEIRYQDAKPKTIMNWVSQVWPFAHEIKKGDLYYEISNDAGTPKTLLSSRRMYHLRGFGDGPVGANVIAYAAESLGWARAAQLFGAAFFGNGMTPAGIVIVSAVKLTDSVASRRTT